ncbi:MAG: cytochrome c oxidase accessory protein CcoG [Saprospiraceae bacterium]|nr:cytochrome c oxidase accessory protein CcoG [Saprospiraceae bacterium]
METPEVDTVDHESYRDSLATVDEKGKRIWIYPKKPKGKFYNYRKWVSYFLLLVLFGLPWIKVNGEPLVLINILERKFIIFGVHIGTQDFHIMVVAMLILVVFITLFTVIFGRLFCGWVCPQTIFMEMVYRRIEYWIEGDANAQRRLNKQDWDADKVIKKVSKQVIFFLIAVLIANTFLAYIIGTDEVLKIITEPVSMHLQGFLTMLGFSFVFYMVFSQLREQVCTTICPYGRLQGVLLDKKSLAVYYDFERGEPRGRMKKNEDQSNKGDCIDCNLCVQVCPTGIDIRNGVQLECVNCTACMDACDEVMTKIKKPTGLIRWASYEGIVTGVSKIFNSRTIAYSSVLLILIALESFLFISRTQVEVLLLRTPGMLFQKQDDGTVSNLYNYQVMNKTDMEVQLEFRLKNIEGRIEMVGATPSTIKHGRVEGALFIKIDPEELPKTKTKIIVEIYGDGELLDKSSTSFLGPMK